MAVINSRMQTGAGGPDEALAIYIHWPFCAQKCPYCDFNSHVRPGGWDERRFLAAYKRELSYMASRAPGGRVGSVFFGGGTPSLMQAGTVAALVDHIAGLWTIGDGAEITLEANPGSVEAERFQGYRAAGVNRVSIGVQSLIDGDLRRLGRIHSSDEAVAAIRTAERIFPRFSFDLIYARPGQTPDSWQRELSEALALARGHVSLYQLTIERGTPFAELHHRGKLQVPEPGQARALYETTQDLTEARGLPAYEISNHAAPGEECHHNLTYWRYGRYAGCGPGAHGRLIWSGHRTATVCQSQPEDWVKQVETQGHGIGEMCVLTGEQQADEMLLMGLRLREGVDLDRIALLANVTPDPETLRELIDLGLVEYVPAGQTSIAGSMIRRPVFGRLRATPAGWFVLNQIVFRLSASFRSVAREPEDSVTKERSALNG